MKLLARVKSGIIGLVDGATATRRAAAVAGPPPIPRRARGHNGRVAR